MFSVAFFPATARILIVGRDFWDVPEALRFHEAMRDRLDSANQLGRPFRMLADLSGHVLQDSRVSEINGQTAELVRASAVERYALIVPSALLRLQTRRLMQGITFSLFETHAEAAEWLDWPLEDIQCEVGKLFAPAG
jgi:hypothetical protein